MYKREWMEVVRLVGYRDTGRRKKGETHTFVVPTGAGERVDPEFQFCPGSHASFVVRFPTELLRGRRSYGSSGDPVALTGDGAEEVFVDCLAWALENHPPDGGLLRPVGGARLAVLNLLLSVRILQRLERP